MKALFSGIKAAMQGITEPLSLLTWETLESRACGAKIFDVEKFKSITSFDCDDDHAIVGRFWRVFESMSEAEKGSYLKFVWGRTRLPAECDNLENKH